MPVVVFSSRDGPGGRGEKDGGKSLASKIFTVTVADDCCGEVPLSDVCVCEGGEGVLRWRVMLHVNVYQAINNQVHVISRRARLCCSVCMCRCAVCRCAGVQCAGVTQSPFSSNLVQ